MKEIAARLHISDTWQIETAGMLSQMGCVTLPEKTVQKLCQGEKLTAQESELVSHHPEVGANLMGQIPRMQEVAEIIAFQQSF